MKLIKPGRKPGRERGNVTLELAIALPLLLLITAGIIDLGRLYWEKTILTNAAREGARAASRAKVDGAAALTAAQVKTIVSAYLTSYQITTTLVPGSNFSYTYNTGVSPPTLSVSLTGIPVTMMILPNIQTLYQGGTVGYTVNLSAQTNMSAEWVTP